MFWGYSRSCTQSISHESRCSIYRQPTGFVNDNTSIRHFCSMSSISLLLRFNFNHISTNSRAYIDCHADGKPTSLHQKVSTRSSFPLILTDFAPTFSSSHILVPRPISGRQSCRTKREHYSIDIAPWRLHLTCPEHYRDQAAVPQALETRFPFWDRRRHPPHRSEPFVT